MKLSTASHVRNGRDFGGFDDAVSYVIEEHVRSYRSDGTGELERLQLRHDALQNMLARLLDRLTRNGVLRVEQVAHVLNDDVTAEE